jgi:perosamine synthetase
VLGNRTVILAPSGRIALYWILAAMDMAPGDEVVTQAFNFTAVPAAIEAAGARPVFVDVARDGFGPDPEQLARVIGPRTRAVLVTHLYGNPADLGGASAVCEEHGVPLIEDCAQAVGATYEGRAVGTFGLATFFTFGPTKNFTLLGGGAVATADPDLSQRMAQIARRHRRVGVRKTLGLAAKAAVITVATSPLPFEVATFPAIRLLSAGGGDPVHKVMAEPDSPLEGVDRYRSPSGAMAAVGLAQLKNYEDLNRARERNGWDLYQRLRGAEGVTVPLSREGNIFLSFPVLHPRRKAFAAELRRRGVDTDLGFMCDCASHAMFPGSADDCPEARRAASEIVHLPVHPYLSERGRDRIVDAVVEAVRSVG